VLWPLGGKVRMKTLNYSFLLAARPGARANRKKGTNGEHSSLPLTVIKQKIGEAGVRQYHGERVCTSPPKTRGKREKRIMVIFSETRPGCWVKGRKTQKLFQSEVLDTSTNAPLWKSVKKLTSGE